MPLSASGQALLPYQLIADMREHGYKGWTVRGTLTPLERTLGYAARRGLIGHNPMQRLEPGERPKVGRQEMRILSRSDIGALIEASDEANRPLLATALFTGLRMGELIGLTWANIDFDAGCVRRQLGRRDGARVETKTGQAVRDVILMPPLARILREHRLRSPFATEGDFAFASSVGQGLDQSVPRRALKRALADAGLDGQDRPPLRFHDLRHTFASLLIAQGENVVWVSRQLGHESPNTTLRVYAHLFDGAEHAERTSAALAASFGSVLEARGGE